MKRILVLVVMLIVIPLSSANAINISYNAMYLGSEDGSGLWQFDYYISDYTFKANEGLQLFFEHGYFENITPVSSSPDWDFLAWDPELIFGVPEHGVYDALAMVDNASLSADFSVQFDWIGPVGGSGGVPYVQSFLVYDGSTNFSIIESGQLASGFVPDPGNSAAPVPEPGTFVLLAGGIAGLYFFKRKNVCARVE